MKKYFLVKVKVETITEKMKVKKMIEEIKKFDEDMEVQYDFEEYMTFYIDGVKETTEDYKEENEKIVVIY